MENQNYQTEQSHQMAMIVRQKFETLKESEKQALFKYFQTNKLKQACKYYGFKDTECDILEQFILFQIDSNVNEINIETPLNTDTNSNSDNSNNLNSCSLSEIDVGTNGSGSNMMTHLDNVDNAKIDSELLVSFESLSLQNKINTCNASNDILDFEFNENLSASKSQSQEEVVAKETENDEKNEILMQDTNGACQKHDVKLFKCPKKDCEIVYLSRRGLTTHIQTHSKCEEIPFQCEFCSFVTDLKNGLQIHIVRCPKRPMSHQLQLQQNGHCKSKKKQKKSKNAGANNNDNINDCEITTRDLEALSLSEADSDRNINNDNDNNRNQSKENTKIKNKKNDNINDKTVKNSKNQKEMKQKRINKKNEKQDGKKISVIIQINENPKDAAIIGNEKKKLKFCCPKKGCDFVAYIRKQVLLHMQEHGICDEIAFACQFCEFVTDSKQSLQMHVRCCSLRTKKMEQIHLKQ